MPVNSDSDNTLMIVLVTSITAVIVTALLIILIVMIICMKKHKSMVSDCPFIHVCMVWLLCVYERERENTL